MYAAVHATSDGQTTPARFALTASRHGYDGLVLRGSGEGWDRNRLEAIGERYDVDVVSGAQLTLAEPATAGGAISSMRPQIDVLCVAGASTSMNRYLVEQDPVDVLASPLTGDAEMPHTAAKAAKEHGVYVEIDLGPILRRRGGRRVAVIRETTRLFDVIDHFDVPYVVSANARSHLEVRAWRELCALGTTIGLGEDAIEVGLSAWGKIAARSRRASDDTFIEPAVRPTEHETDDR